MGVRTILSVLEGVLERDIKHPGACHLYIHLVEASAEPGRAEACADHLGDATRVDREASQHPGSATSGSPAVA